MLVSHAGSAFSVPASDKADAEKSATAIREFLGLH
jgi:hypothetical protein